MKKRIISLALVTALSSMLLLACSSSDKNASATSDTGTSTEDVEASETSSELTKVVLNEVAHSIFYAPMYVAIEEGYFEDEGIDLDLVTGFGAI